MRCPACGRELTEMKAGDITVHACLGGCGGIWFERFEIGKVDLPSESAGEALLHIARDPAIKVDPTQRRQCPRCNTIMMQHFFDVKRMVTVDECPKCAGIWLDAGELATIRSEFNTEKERQAAAARYFDDIFGKQLAELHARSEEHAEHARKIARLFRFICPSYYLPGKQAGAAF